MSTKLALRGVLFAVVAAGLTACGAKVDCNSDTVKNDALEIIQSHLDAAVWYREMKIAMTGEPRLENIKTVDERTGGTQARCRASYSYTYNDKPRAIDVTYNLAYVEDKKSTEVRVVVDDVKGGLMALAMTEKPIKNGEEKVYDTYNGNLIAVRHWTKGVEDGTQVFYDRKTKGLVHQYTAVSGRKDGEEKAWSADGTVTTNLKWKDGKATGEAMTEPGSDQLTNVKDVGYSITQLDSGQKRGQRKTYRTGSAGEYLAEVETFKDNQLDGLRQKFNQKGELVWQARYSQGQLDLDAEESKNTINDCVANRADRYRRTWATSYRPQELEQRIADETSIWEADCKEGRR
jgi:antitoxin component YwqK of YwqJK toxin-antitoxin module